MRWVVKGPGMKLGAQMFDRMVRCTSDTLHHLQDGGMYVYIKHLSSSDSEGCAPPFVGGLSSIWFVDV